MINSFFINIFVNFLQHLVDFQLFLGLSDHVGGEAEVQLVRIEGRQVLAELRQNVVPQLHVIL